MALRMVGNSEEIAARLKVGRVKMGRALQLYAASTLYMWSFYLRESLESLVAAVQSRGGRLPVLFFSLAYDETPMRVTIQEHDEADPWTTSAFEEGDRRAWAHLLAREPGDTAPCKLLHTEVRVGALVEVEEKSVPFTWSPPTTYQAMARTTADCHYDC